MTREEALTKLRTARRRLEGALDRFYGHNLSGDPIAFEAAALDISVPIRVMVHHFPAAGSIALLHQLDPEFLGKPIHFSPTIAPPSRTLAFGTKTFSVAIPLNITLSDGGTAFNRYRGDNNAGSSVPLRDWWFGPCWDSGMNQVSNKDIVLALANKEGGAHVGDDLSAKYKAAKAQGRLVVNGKPISDVVRIGSLVGIAGDELLEYLSNNFPEC